MLINYAPCFGNSSSRLGRLNVGYKSAPLGPPGGVCHPFVVKSLKTECHVEFGGLREAGESKGEANLYILTLKCQKVTFCKITNFLLASYVPKGQCSHSTLLYMRYLS